MLAIFAFLLLLLPATKADEAARKKREKEELWNAEQQQAVGAGTKVKSGTAHAAAKKGGKKKKDDLSLLQDALVKGADQKLKERRAAEEAKRRRAAEEEQRKLDKKNNFPMMDPLLQNTETMLQVPAGTSINRASMEEGIAASGLDGALESLGIGGGNANSSKMTYKEFEERMLPVVKEDYPGLRLTQYKDKVFHMWKKSPENPSNQLP
jgi:hypothetical protein